MRRAIALSVVSLIFAAAVTAHERPIVKIAVTINSATIGKRLEADQLKRKAAVEAAQKRIAETVASKMGEVFAFVRWMPVDQRQSDVGRLNVKIDEIPQPAGPSAYLLTYERTLHTVPPDELKTLRLQYGGDEPLFAAGEDKPLGNAVKLGDAIATKVVAHFRKKRAHAMKKFFSLIALCSTRPTADPDHSFKVHLPFSELKAAENSIVMIEFRAKTKAQDDEGTLDLTPLRPCAPCGDSVTRGFYNGIEFPGIGRRSAKEWTDDIFPLFDKQYVSSTVYMKAYWSTMDEEAFDDME